MLKFSQIFTYIVYLYITERPFLKNPAKVEAIQCIYVEALYAYVTNKSELRAGVMFAKLLDVLTQLRSLSVMNSEECESFVNKNKKLPDLLTEVWDISKKPT